MRRLLSVKKGHFSWKRKENSEDGNMSPEERMKNYFLGARLGLRQGTSNMCPIEFQNCDTVTAMGPLISILLQQ